MNVKMLDRILNVVSSIPLIGLFAISYLPDPFPFQFAENGSVSRWGSHFEFILYFIIPIVIGWGGYLLLLWRRRKAADHQVRNEGFIINLLSIAVAAYEVVMIWVIVFGIQTATEQTSTTNIGLFLKLFGIAVGVLILFGGFNLSKSDFQSGLGFTTPWSKKDETAWAKTQRFVGIYHVVLGAALAIYSFSDVGRDTNGLYILVFVLAIAAGSYLISFLVSKEKAKS